VNQKKIVGQLEKIVGSFQLQAKEISMLDGKGGKVVQQRQ
jgi:hypothetical protein